jgi:transposase
MEAWVTAGVTQGEAGALERVFRTNDRGHAVLAAEGYEFERACGVPGGTEAWTERVLVLRSPMHAQQQAVGLATRLSHAETQLAALTPPRGRGKRQITDEATLVEAIDKVLKAYRVSGLLSIAWEKQIERTTHYVGRGRGSASRGTQVIEKVRYHLTHIAREANTIAALTQRFGWKAFVTNAGHTRLSLQDAVLCYRNEYRVERIFNRLKSRVHIAPLFVKRNEQIEGLTYLLTLGVRVLTVMEFVLQRSLENDQAKLPSLHPENKQKRTAKPTAERILQAFRKISLTIIQNGAGEEILRRLTPLSALQEDILQRQGLGTALYGQLEIQNIKN